jgi:hypothetical protein
MESPVKWWIAFTTQCFDTPVCCLHHGRSEVATWLFNLHPWDDVICQQDGGAIDFLGLAMSFTICLQTCFASWDCALPRLKFITMCGTIHSLISAYAEVLYWNLLPGREILYIFYACLPCWPKLVWTKIRLERSSWCAAHSGADLPPLWWLITQVSNLTLAKLQNASKISGFANKNLFH